MVTFSTLPTFQSLDEIEDDILQAYDMIILVRGEHYSQGMYSDFYDRLAQFISRGGVLFATSWVSWETRSSDWFANVLPFTHVRDTYNENVIVNCRPTDNELSQKFFPKEIACRISFELLYPKGDSIILLETDDNIPVFGYHQFGKGICYYYNTCQHFCLGSMPSPFRNNTDLYDCFQSVLKWIYSISKHTQ